MGAIGLFGVATKCVVSIEGVEHTYRAALPRCQSKHRARVWPYGITLQYTASPSLCAAGMTSFGPTAAQRLDDVRCPGRNSNKELKVEAMQQRVRSRRAFCPRTTL